MRKVSGSIGVGAPQYATAAGSHIAPKISREAAGGFGLVLLALLYWLIFYQNLPDNLNGMAGDDGGAIAGDLQNRIVKIALITVSLYVIATRWSQTRQFSKYLNSGAVAFLLLCLFSAMWSIAPASTIFRFVSLASLCLLCFAICVTGWHRQRFQQLALPPLMFILVASLIVGVILPDRITEIGTDISQKDAWHGITHGKNEFGMMASLGVIICINSWLAREGRSYWAIAGTAASAACLILSRSNTSQFATIVAVLSMVLVMRVPVIRQRYSTLVIVAIAGTILLYELAIQNVIPGVYTLLTPFTSLTGKDATFSARTIIWDIVKDHMHYAPYLGTGYGAYWLGPVQSSPSYVFVYKMHFYPTETHNGYLETINDLGYVGLACLFWYLISYMRQALQLIRTDRAQASLYLALLFQELVMNMSESDWFSRTSTCAVLLLATICLSRGIFEASRRAQATASDGH